MSCNFKINEQYRNALSYDDVFIIPQYSDVSSRKEVDITTTINGKIVEVPIANANMETIADEILCNEVKKFGGIPTLHRFQPIKSACVEYQKVSSCEIKSSPVFVSVGVNRDSKERAQELYNIGAREFIIDIAHGDSYQMKTMIQWMKQNLPGCYILAGNVATGNAVKHLGLWGADGVKVGISNGSVCITKNVTGVNVPMFTSVQDCVITKNNFEQKYGRKLDLCADGGIKEIGCISKALGCGADFIMSGRLFANCVEAPGHGLYRGSASSEVQSLYRTDKEYIPTPEGKSISLNTTNETVVHLVNNISGGIRSACSYVGAKNLNEFKEKCTFGIRHNKP